MYQLAEYPVRGLVFECGQNLPDMADFVAEVCVRLQEGNIPHNLFIVDCGMRVFLYPNAFAAAKAEVSRSFVDHDLIPDVILHAIVISLWPLPRFVWVHYILCKTMHSTWICARLPYYLLSGPWVSCKCPAVK